MGDKHSLDVPERCLHKSVLADIWRGGITRRWGVQLAVLRGRQDRCNFSTPRKKIQPRSLISTGFKAVTFPTAGRFLSQSVLDPSVDPLRDAEVAVPNRRAGRA